ncbi:hypothetical protein SERLA73DRAFT_146049 [Serpula lacrymans var. lacrymans S7.3]|uniref:Uncharacterized protein n=1 Tax=Serpula lacrymans var. lacrymans (strain S7.3) TaxID=936435 RepID=F8QF00_SERL3|nr:hypothetical protein SERLA73DRAFT_146049 [Serpula lacrymans var. lacrymans S7.3]
MVGFEKVGHCRSRVVQICDRMRDVFELSSERSVPTATANMAQRIPTADQQWS